MDILSSYPEWLITHGAALCVVLPLMMGTVTAILPRERMA